MKCPICSSESTVEYTLSDSKIKEKLSRHFNVNVPQNVEVLEEYKIEKCSNCSFSFANPQVEGTKSFYDWITVQNNYYPSSRWEYSEVKKQIESNSQTATVFDVGCGDGKFFDILAKDNFSKISFSGLDLTNESITKCNLKGYEAYCLDIKNFKETYPDKKFDYVVSFHCLEHVRNPLEFIEDLKSLLKPNGEIYVSTPYSPMTIEFDWFDILNNPPHHLGRWNKNSYEELAKRLNLKVEFFMPKPGSILSTTLESFLMSQLDIVFSRINNVYLKFVFSFVRNPINFFKHLYHQLRRERVNNIRASNVVLVKLHNN